MLKVTKVYSYICDGCGKNSCDGDERVWWDDKFDAWSTAVDDDWQTIGSKEYCPNCWEYDDNDEPIVKEVIK